MFFITKLAEQKFGEFNTVGSNSKIGEYEGGFVVCDVTLMYNQKSIYPFFTRGCYKDSDAQYSSQSFFAQSKRTIQQWKNKVT